MLWYTWLANAPHFLLSVLYICLNNYMTKLCSAFEWNRLAKTKKTLRVTKPVASQRSTHFLQLPYRWAVPLTVLSGFMHWILSQTIFLSRLESLDGDGNLQLDKSLCTCGYSTSSAFVLVGLLTAELIGTLLSSLGRFREQMPVAVNCSLVISAACHPPPDDFDAYKKPVHWGVVQSRFGGVGHCAITSEDTTRPNAGSEYA